MSKTKAERNAEIVRLHDEESKTLTDIAKMLGLSQQRTCYIYHRETDKFLFMPKEKKGVS